MFETLVEEGEKVQERTKTAADERLAEVRAKASGTWDKLEQVFEDRVARALHSLSVPSRKDIDVLSQRVAELTEIAKKLSAEEEAHAPQRATQRRRPSKTAARRSETQARPPGPAERSGPMSRRRRNGKVGIALAGGGPLGGIYEIGALVALEAGAEGRRPDRVRSSMSA